MATGNNYSIDTSAIIDWLVRDYPMDSFPSLVKHIEKLINDGRLRASREVYEELKLKNDDCYNWAKKQKDLFVDSSEEIQEIVMQLKGQYFNPENPKKGISGADLFVIALAIVQHPTPWIVVTSENPGSIEHPKIPFVCKNFKPKPLQKPNLFSLNDKNPPQLRSIKFLDLIKLENWRF